LCAHLLRNALRRALQHGVQVAHAADALLPWHMLADLIAFEQLAQHGAAEAGRMDIHVLLLTCSDANMNGSITEWKANHSGACPVTALHNDLHIALHLSTAGDQGNPPTHRARDYMAAGTWKDDS